MAHFMEKKSIFLLKHKILKIVLSLNWLIRTLKNEFLICDCIYASNLSIVAESGNFCDVCIDRDVD